ncbi:MAG: hypothetical protein FWG39_00540 [Alphaproteobacteria bacterium]|nr:hypothetical protein [Alphaproteobacteria bacterium]
MSKVSKKLVVFATLAFGLCGIAAAQLVGPNPNPTARPAVVAANVGTIQDRGPSMRQLRPLTTTGTTGTNTPGEYNGTCDNPVPEQLDALRCTMRYMSCLKMEMVCGENFELCDTEERFKAGRMYCESELVRCPADVINHMFGLDGTDGYAKVSWTDDNASANRALCDGEWKVVRRSLLRGGTTIQLSDIKLRFSTNDGANQKSALGREIWAGALWAASHAVTTCERVANACLTRACQDSPHKCLDIDRTTMQLDSVNNILNDALEKLPVGGSATNPTNLARLGIRNALSELQALSDPTSVFFDNQRGSVDVDQTLVKNYANNMLLDATAVNKYLEAECKIEIGSNRFCYMTVNPSNGVNIMNQLDITDPLEQYMTYQQVMSGTMNRKNWVQTQAIEWLAAAVASSYARCTMATETCIKDSCGRGSMAMCYGMARDAQGQVKLWTGASNELIETFCKPQINDNQYCRNLAPNNGSLWPTIWNTSDGKGLALRLSTRLQSTFSQTGLNKMEQTCQNAAKQCVRRECGDDFTGCLIRGVDENSGRNQGVFGTNNVISGVRAGGFSREMAQGLCIGTVKNIQMCRDWFDLNYALKADGWVGPEGDSSGVYNWSSFNWDSLNSAKAGESARDAWAGMCTSAVTYFRDVTVELEQDEDGKYTGNYTTTPNDELSMQSSDNANCALNEKAIFNNLIDEVAMEAQQRLVYQANAAKNACEARNRVAAAQDNFMWAAVDSSFDDWGTYAVKGLATDKVERTAYVWGGFCAVRVSMVATNTTLEKHFTNNTRYFSVGDTIMCGSWLTDSDMKAIIKTLESEVKKPGTNVQTAAWTGAIIAAVGGNMAHNSIMNTMEKNKTNDQMVCDVKNAGCNKCTDSTKAHVVVELNDKKITVSGCKTEDEAEDEADDITKFSVANYSDTKVCEAQVKSFKESKTCVESASLKERGLIGFNDGRGGFAWGNLATTVGSGVIGYMATKRIAEERRDALHRERKDAAVAEFMDSIGSEIHCIVGGKNAGRFGDLIEIK